jgi:hypothetical protein
MSLCNFLLPMANGRVRDSGADGGTATDEVEGAEEPPGFIVSAKLSKLSSVAISRTESASKLCGGGGGIGGALCGNDEPGSGGGPRPEEDMMDSASIGATHFGASKHVISRVDPCKLGFN